MQRYVMWARQPIAMLGQNFGRLGITIGLVVEKSPRPRGNLFANMMKQRLYILITVFTMAYVATTHSATLTIGLSADVTSMDPHLLNLGPNVNIADHTFGTLLLTDERQRPIPGLAEAWRALDDTTWEFRLRKGVRFHDGTEFTADDVKFTLDRAGAGQFGVFTRAIINKRVMDRYTIQLKTATPHPNLPIDLRAIPIVSFSATNGAVSADFESGKAVVGAGPYKLARFARGDRIELVRHEGYWGTKPYWDRVTFTVISNDPARVAALLSGAVQIIDAVPTADIVRLKNDSNLAVVTTSSNRLIHIHLDNSRDRSPFITDKNGRILEGNPFKDVRVRRAFSKAINRDAIVKIVMEGNAIAAGQFVPEGMFGFSPNLRPEPYDPDGARKLLAEAGFPDGFGITLHGPNNRYVNDEKIVQAIAQMLARVGISTKVVTLPVSIFMTRAQKLEFSVALLGWGVSTGEASYPLRALVATWNDLKGNGTYNLGRYSNAKMDEMLTTALATIDNTKRERLLQSASELAIRDYGIVPLHFQVNTWAMHKSLTYEPRMDERTYAHTVRPRK